LSQNALDLADGNPIAEYARQMIFAEEQHGGEVDKMLRKPGDVEVSGLGPSPLR
jgi:bacterioferritin